MSKVVVIVQARLTSKRLPRKILKKVHDKTILEHCVDRAKLARSVHEVVVAIPDTKENKDLENFCISKGIEFCSGPEQNVIQRYALAAQKTNADVIVRVTSDCPLIDPRTIGQAVHFFCQQNADYVSNTVPVKSSLWPDGSDVEVFSMQALKRALSSDLSELEQEHVTFRFWRDKTGAFTSAQLMRGQDLSMYRYTLDYKEDFLVVECLFDELKKAGIFGHVEDLAGILSKRKSIRSLNAMYHQGQGWGQ